MRKRFNVTGLCYPSENYMVNIEERLKEIKAFVAEGKYFVINRARQYGKTTALWALQHYLQPEYTAVLLSFQKLSSTDFASEYAFTSAFADILVQAAKSKKIMELDADGLMELEAVAEDKSNSAGLRKLFKILGKICECSSKPLVLMIDEVDNASNNQFFLDFLARLRDNYLDRKSIPVFQSVILAGVYDIRTLKLKIRPEEDYKYSGLWNIATDFKVDMSFSSRDIANMLADYEKDNQTGMNVEAVADAIYEYTSGYPYQVSHICKLIDEQKDSKRNLEWSIEGVKKAVNVFIEEKNTWFDDLNEKLRAYPELYRMLEEIIFLGQSFTFNLYNSAVNIGNMFGFVKEGNDSDVVVNGIFEMYFRLKKIRGEILEKITSEDVFAAIKRWDEEQDLKLKYRDSKKYYLYVDGKTYPSKPIFVLAYENHYKVPINVTNLTGGDSDSSCVVSQLRDRLGFEIVLKENQVVDDEKDDPYVTIMPQKEGKKREVYVTKYERNSANRKKAIKLHGTKCEICKIDFEEVYGEAGRNFIEVHHIKPLAEAEEEIEVDPETDLVCICANCHRIIHRRRDKIYSVEEMKAMVGNKVVGLKDIKDD